MPAGAPGSRGKTCVTPQLLRAYFHRNTMMETVLPAISADDDAMRQVAAGDSSALALLFERHKERLFGFLYHLTGDRALSEDLLSETFLRVYRARGRYRHGNGFTPWLLAIARNLALGELRHRGAAKRAHERLQREASAWEDPCWDAAGDDTRERVREALQKLPEEQRSALLLKEYQGLSYREVAQVLGCTEEAARARTYRGRLALRDALREWWEGEALGVGR
jgi:RNA polymerase sigma-70 factor (ECF subfamily)